jgi:hypothetical protein
LLPLTSGGETLRVLLAMAEPHIHAALSNLKHREQLQSVVAAMGGAPQARHGARFSPVGPGSHCRRPAGAFSATISST